jgi:acyl carrier protein
MKEKVYEIVASIMHVSAARVNEDSSPQNMLRWDSLNHMKLIMALEEVFDLEFSDADITGMKDVESILERLSARDR